jgi:AraC-like DNA-binding protein
MINALPTPATYTRVLLQNTPAKDRPALLQGTGLLESSLPTSRFIRADQQLQVFRNASQLSKNPNWALALGQQLNINSHGSLGFAAMSAPNLGTSLDSLSAFGRIRAPYLLFGFKQIQDQYHFTIEPALDLGGIAMFIDEIVLQVAASLIKTVLGHMVPGIKIMLGYPAPEHASEYPEYFSAPCEFNQHITRIELPQRLCKVPCVLHDQQTYISSLARCRISLAAIIDSSDVVTQTQNIFASHFDQIAAGTIIGESPQLDDIANSLYMSPRTLIRKLAVQGSGYRELLEGYQKETACKLLGQARYSVSEIATRLGYNDAANFGRAFRRWFGVAPGQYRRL